MNSLRKKTMNTLRNSLHRKSMKEDSYADLASSDSLDTSSELFGNRTKLVECSSMTGSSESTFATFCSSIGSQGDLSAANLLEVYPSEQEEQRNFGTDTAVIPPAPILRQPSGGKDPTRSAGTTRRTSDQQRDKKLDNKNVTEWRRTTSAATIPSPILRRPSGALDSTSTVGRTQKTPERKSSKKVIIDDVGEHEQPHTSTDFIPSSPSRRARGARDRTRATRRTHKTPQQTGTKNLNT